MKRLRPALLCSLLVLALPGPTAAQDHASLDRQAMEAYQRKDFARSADLFAQAVAEAREDEPSQLYNAACTGALAGRTDAAFGFLRRAIDAGYDDAAQLEKDTDLASLRGDPRWPGLLDGLQAMQARERLQWKSPALATPWREELSEDERVAGLSRLWSEAKFNFVNFDKVPGLDWDALYIATLPKVRAARSTTDYYRELAVFMAHLHDGHSGVWPAMDRLDTAYARPGLETRLVEGRVMVDAVIDERLAAMGIARGWEVVAVQGEPVRSYAEREVAPSQPASTDHDRLSRTYERSLLAGDLGSAIEVGFRDPRGRMRTLALPRIGLKQQTALGPQGSFEWRMLPGNIAWVQLRSFNDDSAAKAFEAAFDDMSKADGLILDVRENGGGNSSVGYRILSSLTDRAFQGSAWVTREYRPAYRAWGRPEGHFRGSRRRWPRAARACTASPSLS